MAARDGLRCPIARPRPRAAPLAIGGLPNAQTDPLGSGGRALMRPAIPRVDSYLIATLVTATGADRAVRLVAQVADPQSLAMVARRFVDVEILTFGFEGGTVYVTITDVIALTTATIVLIRFAAWLLWPLARILWR